jgi:ADP-ribosylglycohydrolase
MRVSPIGWAFETLDEVLEEAKKSAEVSHNHPEGIKGAQAVASAVYLARIGKNKREIEKYITDTFHYNLNRTIEDIRPDYIFEVSCQKSVPEAIIAFLESDDFDEAVRLAVSLGGDSDTIACITGAIAEAFYMEVPSKIVKNVSIILGPDLMKDVIMPFSAKYGFSV